MNLIDTHAHLYYDQFAPDFDSVITRAKDTNLKVIINIGADIESSKKSLELESDQIKFYSSIGLHPHETSRLVDIESIHKNIEKLAQMHQNNASKIIAVGECGLDYYFQGIDYSPSSLSESQQKILQKELFIEQVNLAKNLNLPLIIHCRDSWQDIFIPELADTTGVFHSFTATEVEAKKAFELGYYLGLSCIVTYPKNEHLREIIKWAPLDKILTETDCPFLPPQSQRGQRNEPANVLEVIKVIADEKGISIEEAAQATWENACTLFSLPTNQVS